MKTNRKIPIFKKGGNKKLSGNNFTQHYTEAHNKSYSTQTKRGTDDSSKEQVNHRRNIPH